MSKNISKLSGRIGLKNNLFQKISERSLASTNDNGMKEIADQYHVGVSTIHGAESFYEFLRPEHRKKKAFVCNGSACMCAGTQDSLKKKLKKKLGEDKVASTSFLMDDKLLNLDQFKSLLEKFINFDKKEIVKLLLNSNLSGRGGAGFPAGMKWDFCSKEKSKKKYVICNADEGDSGAFSDRYLLEDQPLKVLFGMIICGYVIGSNEGVLYIRGEYPKSIEAINGSINALKSSKLLGENILGTNFSFDLNICVGQGAYICGEETALIASIEGRRAEVDVRPPFPVTEGLYKKPTVVNNVETLAAATGILIHGSDKFSSIGNKKSAGTKLVCFDSFFNNPGVYEVDMCTPMKKIINEIGGGFKEPVKALQIGGPLGGVVPIEEVEKLNLDFQEFTAAGFMLGHGSIVSIPKDFSMIKYIHHLFEFSAEESCGKCFPGRLGSYRGKEMFDQAIEESEKIPLKLLNELLVTMKKGCLCALCGAIPVPIMNILKYFSDEMKNDIVQEN